VICVVFIVVPATVDMVQCHCVVYGGYFRYINSRYSEIILGFMYSYLWLQQH